MGFHTKTFRGRYSGRVVGLDREYRAKEAGYRTHFLVSLGSALIMVVSQYGFQDVILENSVSLDPSRVAAQVVSGIGFIGAGTIIIQKQFVRGLTTAAGIWRPPVSVWPSAQACTARYRRHFVDARRAGAVERLVFKSIGMRSSLVVFIYLRRGGGDQPDRPCYLRERFPVGKL